VIVGRRQLTTPRVKFDGVHVHTLMTVRVLRHTTLVVQRLMFGTLNVQSANNKIDEIMDIRHDHALDVMLLSETWHDSDSVSIRRLRAEGLQVLERARPRAWPSSLHVNHGGVAIAAVPGVHMAAVSLVGRQRILTFEHLCACLVVRGSACTVLLVYRTEISLKRCMYIGCTSFTSRISGQNCAACS